jgi:hypothetical protein
VDFFDPAPGPNQKKAQKKIPESCCDGLRQTLLPRPSVSSWFAPLLAPPLLPHISALAPFLTLNHVRCPFYAFQLSATAMNTRKHFAKKTNTKQILLTKTQQLGPLPLFAFIFLFYPLQFPPKIGIPSIPNICHCLQKPNKHRNWPETGSCIPFQKQTKKSSMCDCVVKSKADSTVSTATAATAPKEYRVPFCFFSKASVCVWDRSAK